jgi:hypothetical protein
MLKRLDTLDPSPQGSDRYIGLVPEDKNKGYNTIKLLQHTHYTEAPSNGLWFAGARGRDSCSSDNLGAGVPASGQGGMSRRWRLNNAVVLVGDGHQPGWGSGALITSEKHPPGGGDTGLLSSLPVAGL